MKKLLLIITLTLFCVQVSLSQNQYFWNKTNNSNVVTSKKYCPKLERHFSWDSLNNSWVNIAHIHNEYNSRAELIEFIYLDKDSTFLSRETYEYNLSGKQTSKINYLRDTLNNIWNQTARTITEYHQDTLEAVIQNQVWDKNNNTWRTTFRSTKAYSPFNDIILTKIEQISPNDTIITLGEKSDIIYDPNGRKSQEIVIKFNPNTTKWDTFISVNYFYAQNELIEEEITDLYDSTNHQWNNVVKQIYTYSLQDTLTSVERFRFDVNINDWIKVQLYDEIKWISWNKKVNEEANIASYILKDWNVNNNRYDTSKHYSKIILDNFGSNLVSILAYEDGAFIPEQEFWNQFDMNFNKTNFKIRNGQNGAWVTFFEQRSEYTYGQNNELLERIDWDFNFNTNSLEKTQKTIYENFFVLGLKDEKYEALKLYPNPSSGEINIHLNEEDAFAEISNLSGQKIHVQKMIGNTFNLTHLENGVYLLKVTSKDKIYFNKISINK